MKNDDYLWAKIGNDPEIEQLENALAVFRHRDKAEPETAVNTAVNVIPFTPRPRKKGLVFAYAAAASLLLAGLAGSGRLRNSGSEDAKLPEVLPAEATRAAIPQLDSVIPDKQDHSSEAHFIAAKVSHRNTVARTNSLVPARRKPRPKVDPGTAKQSLTKEEKIAYDRLMLALSITSSNLRLVADKIDINDASAVNGR